MVFMPVNTRFTYVINFQSYCMVNSNQSYHDFVEKHLAKNSELVQMQMQMHHNVFDPAEPISVFNFLSTLKMTFISNGASEGASS